MKENEDILFFIYHIYFLIVVFLKFSFFNINIILYESELPSDTE